MTDYENVETSGFGLELMKLAHFGNYSKILQDAAKLEENGYDDEAIIEALKVKYGAKENI